MKLEFYQNGRQFFFITLAVAGRKKILAEIVEEAHEERGTPPNPRVTLARLAGEPPSYRVA